MYWNILIFYKMDFPGGIYHGQISIPRTTTHAGMRPGRDTCCALRATINTGVSALHGRRDDSKPEIRDTTIDIASQAIHEPGNTSLRMREVRTKCVMIY
jgi:hypothetical protein